MKQIAKALVLITMIFPLPIAHNARGEQISFNGLATGAGSANLNVQSFQALKFKTVVKQKYDFSCGSAALATLLLYTYHIQASETSVFTDMFLNGDRTAIQESGFSLLDMKNYLSRRGIPSGGFRAPLEKLAQIRIPSIVLINENGYKHFVVLRGIRRGEVLLADPAIGLRRVSASVFQKQWSGIFFIILANISTARSDFNNGTDWSGEPGAPLDLAQFMVTLSALQQVSVPDLEKF
ncbi:MAG: C39 family peptidase [Rhodospirillales bacterium]|nr:C39 family peptidase [Rhodospirillales bacterium]MDE2318801.1 C39 family peptidase [Rhodospirillales bacterium]